MSNKHCATCGKQLSERNRYGYCQKHFSAFVAQNPEWRARHKAGIKRHLSDPAEMEKLRQRARVNGRTDVATQKRREAAIRTKLWEKGHAALKDNNEAYERAGKRRSATVLAHIPSEKRDDYRRLTSVKKMTSAEATRIILDEHQREIEAFRAELEEQLRRRSRAA